MKKAILILLGMVLLVFIGCGGGSDGDNDSNPMPIVDLQVGEPVTSIQEFETRLESIRSALYIPGMSAAVTKGGQVVWAKGFGYSDMENHVSVDPTTPFHLASLTKPVASVLIMQLVEAGMLDLQEPISTYGIDLGSSYTIRLIHLLTHTSEGVPGSYYSYNGNRFAQLDRVIQVASGMEYPAPTLYLLKSLGSRRALLGNIFLQRLHSTLECKRNHWLLPLRSIGHWSITFSPWVI